MFSIETSISNLKELSYTIEKKAKDYGDAELEEVVKQIDQQIHMLETLRSTEAKLYEVMD